jgi:hypothetical protein
MEVIPGYAAVKTCSSLQDFPRNLLSTVKMSESGNGRYIRNVFKVLAKDTA